MYWITAQNPIPVAKSFNKSNVAITQQSGKVGNVRFYQRGGETYVRSAHNALKTNPRSDLQMRQRLQFASRAVLWRVMKGNLAHGFTQKAATQSDYNAFMKLNDERGVYLTKAQKAKGAQIIFPVQISDGTLDSIDTMLTRGQLKTNIALGTLVIDANTTVGEFANAVVGNNDDFEYDDMIVFVSIVQTINGEGIPKIKSEFSDIKLKKGSSRKVFNLVPANAFQNGEGYLGTTTELPTGCFAYLHTRNKPQFQVSSQTLVNNNAELIAQYTSDEQYQLARDSYGSAKGFFLSQGSDPTVDEITKK